MRHQERSNVPSNQKPPNFNLLIFIIFNSEFEGTLGMPSNAFKLKCLQIDYNLKFIKLLQIIYYTILISIK